MQAGNKIAVSSATLDCRCDFFLCDSDLISNSIPNHCKEKGGTIKILVILSQLIPIFECKSETKSLFHLPLWIVVAVSSCAIPISSAILFQITAKKRVNDKKTAPFFQKGLFFPSIYDKLYHKPVILLLPSAAVQIPLAEVILLVLRTLYLPVSMKCQ